MWPERLQEPINEFNTDGYIAMTFPVLYPLGTGSLSESRSRNLTAAKLNFGFLKSEF